MSDRASPAAASARTVAGRAGVNQTLIFYHFGTVGELLEVACRQAVDEAATHYRGQFARVTSLPGLLDVGRARVVSASFIGLELYEGVDAEGAGQALDALERLGVLVEVVNELGPIARRALRSKLKGVRATAAPTRG